MKPMHHTELPETAWQWDKRQELPVHYLLIMAARSERWMAATLQSLWNRMVPDSRSSRTPTLEADFRGTVERQCPAELFVFALFVMQLTQNLFKLLWHRQSQVAGILQ